MFNLAFFDFFNSHAKHHFTSQSQRAGDASSVLRERFIRELKRDNHLMVCQTYGEVLTIKAISYDRTLHQVVVSDQAETGILYLEEGDRIEIFTLLDENHEYFSFVSQVEKIKTQGVNLFYFLSVPKLVRKTKRRLVDRVSIEHHSIIRLGETSFSGTIDNLSHDGLGFSLRGYYPEELDIGDPLSRCKIDIFQPRINDNISFECDIIVRRISFAAKPERMTHIGGVFTRFLTGKRSMLNEFIEKQQKNHIANPPYAKAS